MDLTLKYKTRFVEIINSDYFPAQFGLVVNHYGCKGDLTRTPLSGGRGVHSGFKSPVQRSAAQQLSPEQEAEQLRQKGAELDSQIAQLQNEGMNIEELDEHIELLHEYNDIKDAAQTLLGQLARVRGVTTAELYSQFGLELED
ncbi:DNA repair protein SWI5 homolog [Engraulis encrasicolus]|uniref:DNA repair protein SWI5 homolog n=1 Tax=Engraulis encrasicolus TaxID=184585 RepID=UPI002FD4140D